MLGNAKVSGVEHPGAGECKGSRHMIENGPQVTRRAGTGGTSAQRIMAHPAQHVLGDEPGRPDGVERVEQEWPAVSLVESTAPQPRNAAGLAWRRRPQEVHGACQRRQVDVGEVRLDGREACGSKGRRGGGVTLDAGEVVPAGPGETERGAPQAGEKVDAGHGWPAVFSVV